MPLKVVLDANVLFPFTLRDTLLRAAEAGYLRVYWSEQILDEMRRSLEGKVAAFTPDKGEHLVAAMTRAFPEAMVTGHERFIARMRNHEKDRHVAAAAVKAGAQVIVTANLKDFGGLPEGIVGHTPDDVLLDLFVQDPAGILDLLHAQAAAKRNPPVTFERLLEALQRLVPQFAAAVQRHLDAS